MKTSYFSARRLRGLALVACLLVSGLSRCQAPGGRGSASGRVVWDQLSRRVVVPPQPERIVSMPPSVTEILVALGVWDRVVGITLYDAYPADSGGRTRIGDSSVPTWKLS